MKRFDYVRPATVREAVAAAAPPGAAYLAAGTNLPAGASPFWMSPPRRLIRASST
jgi:CO/xanthine dehydrogenase FAD-binding subunit